MYTVKCYIPSTLGDPAHLNGGERGAATGCLAEELVEAGGYNRAHLKAAQ